MGNKKGYIPWNTGLKGFKHSGSFKTGQAAFGGKKHSEETKNKIGASRKLENHPLWKGGRIMSHRYIAIKKPDHPFCDEQGYIAEHRLVLEQKLGRYLKPTEIAHHVNENKTDNRPENIELFNSNAEHLRYHNIKRSKAKYEKPGPLMAQP